MKRKQPLARAIATEKEKERDPSKRIIVYTSVYKSSVYMLDIKIKSRNTNKVRYSSTHNL